MKNYNAGMLKAKELKWSLQENGDEDAAGCQHDYLLKCPKIGGSMWGLDCTDQRIAGKYATKQAAIAAANEHNAAQFAAWLAEHAEPVQTLPEGWKVFDTRKEQQGQTALVKYVGTTIDGRPCYKAGVVGANDNIETYSLSQAITAAEAQLKTAQ